MGGGERTGEKAFWVFISVLICLMLPEWFQQLK
jgi:hypothetical protein